jgi:ribosomal protein L7/L12
MERWDPEIEGLVASGRKIDAIRLYRERYPVGLKEAKDAIDALERGEPPPAAKAQPVSALADDPDFAQVIDDLLQRGQTIQAIKRYRERYPVGLKEAKEIVDARAVELGIAAQSRCWIATAAYGSVAAPEVEILRRYRDTILSESALGRVFVRVYYRLSPRVASWLADSVTRQRRVRWLLRPLIEGCRRKLDAQEIGDEDRHARDSR